MANTIIQIKRSTTTNIPANGSLQSAEQAYSFLSDKLFIGNTAGTGVLEIGGKYWVDTTIAAFNAANAAFGTANAGSSGSTAAFNQANTARNHANAAFEQANTARNQANTATTNAGNAFGQANAAFGQANTARDQANTALSAGQAAFLQANTARTHANTAHETANAAFGQANTALSAGQAAFLQANTARTHANAAHLTANAAFDQANTARNHANVAFATANSKFSSNGGTISGDVSIVGNLTLSGSTSFINVQNYRVEDSLIYLAGNNYTSDIVDIGFVGNYSNGTTNTIHTGIFRDAITKEYYAFHGYFAEPENNHIDPAANGFTLAVFNADIRTSNLNLGGVNAISWIRASYDQANTARNQANTATTNAGNAFNQANTALGVGQAAFGQANTALGVGQAAFGQANTALGVGQAAFGQANTALGVGQAAFGQANTARNQANTALDVAQSAFLQANTARTQANTALDVGQSAFLQANTARTHANAAHLTANAAFDRANLVFGVANTAASNATNASALSSGTVPSARLSGSYTGITGVGTLTAGTWNADVIRVPYGGTGMVSFTTNGILYGNAAGDLKVTSAGTEGQVLQASATGVPQFGMLDGGSF